MLMHAATLSNPLSEITKAHKTLTSDTALKKTDEGQLMIAKSEFISSCYTTEKGHLCLPMLNIRKSLIMGARQTKQGKEVEKYVFFDGLRYEIKHDGPTKPEALWEAGEKYIDARPVRVGQSMIMRYRPKLFPWSVAFDIKHEETEISKKTIMSFFEKAGDYIGLGDFRPLYGRYTAKLL